MQCQCQQQQLRIQSHRLSSHESRYSTYSCVKLPCHQLQLSSTAAGQKVHVCVLQLHRSTACALGPVQALPLQGLGQSTSTDAQWQATGAGATLQPQL
jgi:hypothetical protein